MATVLEDMIVFLTGAGLGFTLGTNLHASIIPDSPDSVVAIFEYAGQPPDYVFGGRTLPAFSKPHVQVVTRGAAEDGLTPRTTIESVGRALEGIINQTINGTYYERVERVAEPSLLERDVNRRALWVWNFAVTRTPT